MSEEITLNVLTLNCWGIPFVSKNRTARMNAIAEKLTNGDYDIVCLQEVWSIHDFKMIKAHVQEQLQYSHYFYSGVVGSGVCLLSKYPILDVIFHKWPLNGYVHKIHHGDWFGGKGVGLCKLEVHNALVNVYIAHLHAEYDSEFDEYSAHRVLQAYDTAQFIRMTRGGVDAVILGGDLNTGPTDLAYRIICGIGGLSDACSNSISHIGTNDCAKNSYTGVQTARKLPNGKRIDHILYLGSKRYKVEIVNFEQPFPDRVPNRPFSYSDHEAVMATMKLVKCRNEINFPDTRETLKEAISICEAALHSVSRQRLWYIVLSCILVVPIFWAMSANYTSTSIGYGIGLDILQFFLTAVLCYSIFMFSIWNSVERNSLKAGCSAMEVYLTQVTKNLNSKYKK